MAWSQWSESLIRFQWPLRNINDTSEGISRFRHVKDTGEPTTERIEEDRGGSWSRDAWSPLSRRRRSSIIVDRGCVLELRFHLDTREQASVSLWWSEGGRRIRRGDGALCFSDKIERKWRRKGRGERKDVGVTPVDAGKEAARKSIVGSRGWWISALVKREKPETIGKFNGSRYPIESYASIPL